MLEIMELERVLHMNGGAEQHSYANNSLLQKMVLKKAMPLLEETSRKLYQSLQPECLMMADMGCSSGPNALLIISAVIDVVNDESRRLKRGAPYFGVYLNDLPGNDFNNLFSMLPSFYKNLKQEKGRDYGSCFVSGTPKSFYGRVFPDYFLHFVHSSYSIHWLSQVPQGLINKDGVAINKGNIYVTKTSHPLIQNAYYSQFNRDFTLFMKSRAKEMVSGGRMVLTFRGSTNSNDPKSPEELLGTTLYNMVSKGLIEEDKLDRFNIPVYTPTTEEVRALVEAEGSFDLNRLETCVVDWGCDTTQSLDRRAQCFAKTMRAVNEPLLTSAFGDAITDDVFIGFELLLKERMARERCEMVSIMVSMTKKG